MTAPARREPGTDVAVITAAAVGDLPGALQNALELRKLQNQVAGKLAELNWGKQLDLAARRAVADWGQRHRVDVATEIHVLGGSVYLAAAFYLRKLGELIARGLVEYAFADHIEDDPRLKALGAEGEGEYSRRLRERIKYGVPDKAASAVVFRVKMRSMTHEVTGCKYAGNGTRKNDPVGEQFPLESAESRAARRCLRQLVSHVDDLRDVGVIEDAADDLSERVVVPAREAFKASQARIEAPPHGRQLRTVSEVALTEPENPYSDPMFPTVTTETSEATTDDAPALSLLTLDEANAVTCPYGDANRRLADLSTSELRSCVRTAEKRDEHPAFRRAALIVLEARES